MPACLWLLCAALATACGDSPEEQRAVLRAEAEREFGAPAAEVDSQTRAAAAADDPGEASESAESPPGTDPPSTGARPPEETADPVAESVDPVAEPAGATDPPVRPAETERRPPVTQAPTGQEPSAAALLADADEAYNGLRSLRAAFIQRVDLPLVDRTAQGHGVWYQDGRDRFLMDFTEPADDVYVSDGEFVWLYQPSATPGQVIKSRLVGGSLAAGGADVLARVLSEARASYDATYEGTAIVSGQRSHVIGLTPRGSSDYRHVRVWIADGDRLVRRFRIEEENETIRTVTLAELQPDAPVADSLFRFVPPDGVQVFER